MPDISKEQLLIILGVIAVILIGCVAGVFNQNMTIKPSSPESSPCPVLADNTRKIETISCFVHITGAVAREGLYKLNKGDRLADLLKLSGVDFNADLDGINLAELISDGQKVVIPRKTVSINLGQTPSSSRPTEKSDKTVNINTADEKQLDSLPGIGPAMAKKIVAHRNEKGIFSNIEELKEVSGISEKKFEKLKSCISVN